MEKGTPTGLMDTNCKPIPEETKYPDFCLNDHFVSLWELAWNFDCEDNMLDVVKRLGDSFGL